MVTWQDDWIIRVICATVMVSRHISRPTMHVGVQALIFVPTSELALQVLEPQPIFFRRFERQKSGLLSRWSSTVLTYYIYIWSWLSMYTCSCFRKTWALSGFFLEPDVLTDLVAMAVICFLVASSNLHPWPTLGGKGAQMAHLCASWLIHPLLQAIPLYKTNHFLMQNGFKFETCHVFVVVVVVVVVAVVVVVVVVASFQKSHAALTVRLSGGADAMCWFNPQVPQEIACQAQQLWRMTCFVSMCFCSPWRLVWLRDSIIRNTEFTQ